MTEEGEGYSSELHKFIDRWVKVQNTTWEALFREAGVANASSTLVRRGSVPRPDTLRKLADAMGVPRRQLFEMTGYVTAEELEPEEIDIDDPELRLFFSGHDFDEMTEEEREFVRDAVRMARRLKETRKRLEDEESTNDRP